MTRSPLRAAITLLIILFTLCGTDCSRSYDDKELDRVDALLRAGERHAAGVMVDSLSSGRFSAEGRVRELFLKAVTRDEFHDIESAVSYIMQSKRAADAIGDDSLSYASSLYHAYLCNISGNLNMAVNHAREALALAERTGKPAWTGAACLQLSGSYHAKGMLDSSDYYIDRLIPLLGHQEERDLPDMLNNIAVSLLNRGKVDLARSYLRRSIELRPHEHTYYILAALYGMEGDRASAERMWIKAVTGSDPVLQSRILRSYAEWLKENGEFERASDCLSRSQLISDSIGGEALGEKAMSASMLDERGEMERATWRGTALYGALCIGLASGLLTLWFLGRRKSRKVKNLVMSSARMKEDMDDMAVQMDLLREEIRSLREQCNSGSELRQELEDRVDRKSGELRELESRFSIKEKEMQKMRSIMERSEADRADIMKVGARHFLELKQGGTALLWNKRDIRMFRDYYYLVNPDFGCRIMNEYTSLSPVLNMILILGDMGFDGAGIRRILGMSDGAYRTARSRINSRRTVVV